MNAVYIIAAAIVALAGGLWAWARRRREMTLADTAAKLAAQQLEQAKDDAEAKAAAALASAHASVAAADEAARKEVDRDESLADTLNRINPE